MSIALYRKYRSSTFAELIGQELISATLLSELRSGQLVHAYLFAGIRGTGKTSAARILARAVNCTDPRDGEPCNACAACVEITGGGSVDVLEIDAASNRGIDEMRDLREKVKYLPASLRRKVYIIDEAHMLTTEAWNAFLKTLEEPPDHVLFVLATTEAHKVPETVRSRVQRFDFRRVDRRDIGRHMGMIAECEGAVVDADALDLLARAGRGSVRDALSLLDQVLAGGERPVGLAVVRRSLGLADPGVIRDLLRAVAAGDAADALRACATAFESGADARQLIREAARLGRGAELFSVGYPEGADVDDDQAGLCRDLATVAAPGFWLTALDLLSQTETGLRQPVDPRLQVELCVLRLAQIARDAVAPGDRQVADVLAGVLGRLAVLEGRAETAPPPQPARSPASTPTPPPAAAPVAGGVPASPSPPEAAGVTSPPSITGADASIVTAAIEPAGSAAPADGTGAEWDGRWSLLIDAVNRRDRMLAGVLRGCKPLPGAGDTLRIGAAPKSFHLDEVRNPAKLQTITDAAAEVAGHVVAVEAVASGDEPGPARGRGGGAGNAAPDPTRAALDAFPGSRITATRMRDGANSDPRPR